MSQTHLIVGAGNMGGAILSGWLDQGDLTAEKLVILDPRPGDAALKAIECGALHVTNSAEVPDTVDTILLGIKPQLFTDLGPALASVLPDGCLLISIMAGISSTSLSETFPKAMTVRAMPNTPASIGKGITAFMLEANAPQAVTNRVEKLLSTIGAVTRVDNDDQIDAVTAVSGSGPAYIFYLCEALAEAGMSVGLPQETAMALARATIIGASGLLETSDSSPGELREAVTSPNGTTHAALEVLVTSDRLTLLMEKAVKAAKKRAEELSR